MVCNGCAPGVFLYVLLKRRLFVILLFLLTYLELSCDNYDKQTQHTITCLFYSQLLSHHNEVNYITV